MADDNVLDDEHLYRRVSNSSTLYTMVEGKLRLSSGAFNDPDSANGEKRPSVDRATLRNNDPSAAKTHPTQGVVGLVTSDVRAIRSVTKTDQKGNVIAIHDVDVIPDRLPTNDSHALITVTPNFESRRPFDRLKDSLARLAERQGWLVVPSDA